MTTNYQHGHCAICKKHYQYLRPLHGDKGGALCCLPCIGEFHRKHGRRRKLGRIVIRALAAYLDGGGSIGDFEKLKMSAIFRGGVFFGFSADDDLADPLGYLDGTAGTSGETIELTSELLIDAIKIAHPDLHPPERRELAQRVTQGLLALQPFTFPAHKPRRPEPKDFKPPEPMSAHRSTIAPKSTEPKPQPYPCSECKSTIPSYYCTECRAEFERRNEVEREKEAAKQREWRAKRKARRDEHRPACPCGAPIKGKRTDARFCSATCRQRAHRGVTDKRSNRRDTLNSRDTPTKAASGGVGDMNKPRRRRALRIGT
jgi:hypothetical protein